MKGKGNVKVRAKVGLNYPDPRNKGKEIRLEAGEIVPDGHLSMGDIGGLLACDAVELLDAGPTVAEEIAEAAKGE